MQNETEFKGEETKFFLAWFWEAKHLRSLELSVLNQSLNSFDALANKQAMGT